MVNKQQGHIKKWQDDKGFGFIETQNGDSIFFHINEFKARRRLRSVSPLFLRLGKTIKGVCKQRMCKN